MNVPAYAVSECFDWRDPRIVIQDYHVCVVLCPRRVSHWWDLTAEQDMRSRKYSSQKIQLHKSFPAL